MIRSRLKTIKDRAKKEKKLVWIVAHPKDAKMDWLFFSFYEDNSIFEIPYQDEISKERRGKYHGNSTGRKERKGSEKITEAQWCMYLSLKLKL